MNSKKSRILRRMVRNDFAGRLPERNLQVVNTKRVPIIVGTNLDGSPQYQMEVHNTLAHKNCTRAIYQAAKKQRMQLGGTVSPLLSGVWA